VSSNKKIESIQNIIKKLLYAGQESNDV